MISALRMILAVIAAAAAMVLAAPVLLLGFPFWFTGVLSRLVGRLTRLFEPKAVSWHHLVEFEPVIGWKPKANLDAHGQAEVVFHLTTDSMGWRGQTTLAESEVVVLGDSFAFGHGIDERHFFGEVGRVRIKAVGTNGYNMVQELLWLRRLSFQLRGKLVVWLVYHGNDLYENLQPHLLHYPMPFVKEDGGTGGWRIVTEHVKNEPWPYFTQREYYRYMAELSCPTFLARRAFSACKYLLREGRDACRPAGAELVIVTVPDSYQMEPSGIRILRSLAPDKDAFDLEMPDREIARICRRLDLPFVALRDHLTLRDYKHNDVHWNPRGHRRFAELLGVLHEQHQQDRAEVPQRLQVDSLGAE